MNNRSLILIAATALFASNSFAGKPTKGEDGPYLGNGFPSGPHFNLNIHGKNENFTCPDAEYLWTIDSELYFIDDGIEVGNEIVASACPDGYTCTQGEQVFGNVINLPLDGSDVQIFVESGRKGPKSKRGEVSTELEVTDWCTKPFDSDAASFRLPEDPDGYAVYARATGKPVQEQFFEVFGRDLTVVEVECSADDLLNDPNCEGDGTYDLLLLGLVDEQGAWINYGNGDGNFDRVDDTDGRGGKGVKDATEITGMFEFTGDVCYIYADDPACTDGDPCTESSYCCPTDIDGYYTGACILKETALFWDTDSYVCSNNDGFDGTGAEAPGTFWLEESFYCRSYEDAWIFNIADFVEVLFDVRNNGTYNLQLRFYPLPLQEGKVK